jgi:uncharacterized membrane protein
MRIDFVNYDYEGRIMNLQNGATKRRSRMNHMMSFSNGWMGGWMGGGTWLWTTIGVLVVVLLVIVIVKQFKK